MILWRPQSLAAALAAGTAAELNRALLNPFRLFKDLISELGKLTEKVQIVTNNVKLTMSNDSTCTSTFSNVGAGARTPMM